MFQSRNHRTSVGLKGESEAGTQLWCCLYPFPNLGLHTRLLLAKQQCPLLPVSHLFWTGQSHPNKTWRVLKESFTLSWLLLAFMCFCLHYHKALPLCGRVEEGTPPCTLCRSPCSRNKARAVFMSAHSRNGMSSCTKSPVSWQPLQNLFCTVFLTWILFWSPYLKVAIQL